MTVLLMIASFSLILINDNLLSLAITNSCSCYCSTCYCWITNFNFVTTYNENLIKNNFSTSFNTKFLNSDDIAFCYFILFSTCCNNCVHL